MSLLLVHMIRRISCKRNAVEGKGNFPYVCLIFQQRTHIRRPLTIKCRRVYFNGQLHSFNQTENCCGIALYLCVANDCSANRACVNNFCSCVQRMKKVHAFVANNRDYGVMVVSKYVQAQTEFHNKLSCFCFIILQSHEKYT